MKTLVWDVDDVLNNLMRDWFEQGWLPRHPLCKLAYREIRENPPHRILCVQLEEYLDSLDAFRREHLASLAPNPALMVWFQCHGHRFRHAALTKVPLQYADLSAAWVMKHFGNWIRSFNVVPSLRAKNPHIDYDRSKAEFLGWLGACDMMIDDNPENISAVERRSIATLLWPQPWNNSSVTPGSALESLARLESSR